MTELLLRLFVKDYQNMDAPRVRERYGLLAGFAGLLCNLILFGAKLAIGLLSGGVAIQADAVNNLSDAASCLVTLLGFRLAAKPADREHPFGHARIEYLAGLSVAAMILLIGAELVKGSVSKILAPQPVNFSLAAAAVLLLSILVKLLMARLYADLGRRIGSQALAASAADSRNDVICSGAVLAASALSAATGLLLDGYAGLAVALFILYSGVGVAKDTIDPLLGEAPNEELVHAVGHVLRSDPAVLGMHDLLVHDYGPGRRFASVHVDMDHRMDPMLAHEHIDELERSVQRELHVELVIHYDPVVTDDPELTALHGRVLALVHEISPEMRLHDFRMVRGGNASNLIFDLVVPDAWLDKKTELTERLQQALSTPQKRYYVVLTLDREAFNDPHND